MGGVAGHMDHLYDDRDLTFAGMKEILSVASEGNLSYEEKVDGQNIFLSLPGSHFLSNLTLLSQRNPSDKRL